jgi:hypothetical protein
MIDRYIREQWRRDPLITPARHRQALLPSGAAIDERPQQRKIIREVFQDALEISLQTGHSWSCLCVAPIAPFGELLGNHFLDGFAVGQV